ncbi:hypothetical protein GCM10010873_26640 [Cypionkella aquatica]|uniref:Phage gp6-like head-tail connector protein n=1 Tax=Cypionkella aquatica TaxID=1756042 RepID=A0AA37TY42_9RHOB|nr:phage head-tail connector protein [Cypionkella aquatica]GLS87690.1 hypothetical protein GCM10010873_26640 [Cypionkella aquatica]
MTLQTITPPAEYPVTLDKGKAHLRIRHAYENATIGDMIQSATALVEAFLRRRLVEQSVQMTLDRFCGIVEIPIGPVLEIAKIAYIDTAGSEKELASDTYSLVKSRQPNLITPAYGLSWPSTQSHFDSVKIDIVVGYGAAADVPAWAISAILRTLDHLYLNRNGGGGEDAFGLPVSVQGSLLPHVFSV